MTTVDTRPTLVAGPSTVIAVRGLTNHDHLTVTLNGHALRHRFHHIRHRPGQQPGAVEGVVSPLRLGPNQITATARDHRYGARTVQLRVLDHSLQGPVISGPHQEPFLCETSQQGLPASSQPDCVVPTSEQWWYRDNGGAFHRLAHPYAKYPADVSTVMKNGKRVPFVVRVESVVINRSVTRLALLDDPHKRGPHRAFRPVNWNHRVVWHFGESCGTGYHQGVDGGIKGVFDPVQTESSENIAGPFLKLPALLAQGYMVGQSTLTIFGVHCNQVLSAETLMMVKQYIADHYGTVGHVIGGGASGGAIQQYTIANAYPGVLDAGTPLLSFPDLVTVEMTLADCTVLQHYFAGHQTWNGLNETAVTGLATPRVCQDWSDEFSHILKPTSCPHGIPQHEIYNQATNPGGLRCDLQDDLANIYGTDTRTHAALRPIDSVGVQYGLKALHRGQITPKQFVSLNASVGGISLNGTFQKQREAMTRYEAHRIFRDGIVGEFGAINQTPMIDQTIPAVDYSPIFDIHDQVRPYEIRARLNANYGSHASQTIWSGSPLPAAAIPVADEWLSALDRLQRAHPWKSRAWLVAHSRPASADDSCRVGSPGVPVPCSAAVHAGPRQLAGGPLAEDDFKCRLRPVRRSDYPASMSQALYAKLKNVFRTGVCNYRKHPVGWVHRSRTWLSYGDTTLLRRPVSVSYPLVRSRVP